MSIEIKLNRRGEIVSPSDLYRIEEDDGGGRIRSLVNLDDIKGRKLSTRDFELLYGRMALLLISYQKEVSLGLVVIEGKISRHCKTGYICIGDSPLFVRGPLFIGRRFNRDLERYVEGGDVTEYSIIIQT